VNAHAFINVVIPFDSRRSVEVNDAIMDLTDRSHGNYPSDAINQQLSQVRGMHFMTVTVAGPLCPAELDGDPEVPPNQPAHLVFEISADVGPKALLADLVERFHQSLSALLAAAGIAKTHDELLAFLLKHRIRISDTWGATLGQVFSGSPGMTVERIIGEQALARRLSAEIDIQRKGADWETLSPRQRLERLRNTLWRDPDTNWKWAFAPEAALLIGPRLDDKKSLSNPHFWKMLATIFHRALWPLYVPFLLVVLFVFIDALREDGLIVALMWASFVIFVLLALLGLTCLVARLCLRRMEKSDAVEDSVASSAHEQELLSVENFGQQNHMASVSRLKGGLLRRLTLRLAFILVGAGSFLDAPGFLGKNGVVHFARWMRLPRTDQLMFWSNYDGTWESYVADFIADLPTGVTSIWSNCIGFPRTLGLVNGGAADRDRTTRWARRQQLPTRFWFSAYRNLSAARIRINSAIRQGLATAESYQDCEDWLALFGSVPRPAATLQAQQISTLAFGGLSRMRYSACSVISLAKDDIAKCRKFIEAMRNDAVYGEAKPSHTSALVVGLSAQGLARLGIPSDAIETFPLSFKQGMWTDSRSRALGDLDDNAPQFWKWGGPHQDSADVLVMAYARKKSDLVEAVRKIAREARRNGHRRVFYQRLTLLQDRSDDASCGIGSKEPFGFTDGVSQPIIRGAPRWNHKHAPNDVVEAGELILGYPDNLGLIAPTPSIAAAYDPDHMLPDTGTDLLRQRPDLSTYEGRGRRDLGANGTFLVVRHFKQNVTAFDEWFARLRLRVAGDSAQEREGQRADGASVQDTNPATSESQSFPLPASLPNFDDARDLKEFLFAKFIGRWQDGASLVRHARPQRASHSQRPRQRDNDYLSGAEDPCGHACPFGSHTRRANPRDTRFPGSAEEIAAVNRHRILRVSRVFGKLDPQHCNELDRSKDVGVLFMCLNGDIERQFEFIQKTWLLNPSFHGLACESDPLVGRGPCRSFTIPTTSGPFCLPDLPDLTKLIGGGYFFIPGKALLDFLAAPFKQPVAENERLDLLDVRRDPDRPNTETSTARHRESDRPIEASSQR
jgi:deferrochelatase/peroxidase EfeB